LQKMLKNLKKLFVIALLSTFLAINHLFSGTRWQANKILSRKNSMKNNQLCVIATVFNPASYKSRFDLYKRFEKHIQSFDVKLITVELVFFDREFEVTQPNNMNHIQLRTDSVLWFKENLINIGLKRSTEDCKYIAWIDSEIEFINSHWVEDAKRALEKHKIIQLFDSVRVIGPNLKSLIRIDLSFGKCNYRSRTFASNLKFFKKVYSESNLYVRRKKMYCATGYAWAARRHTLLEMGGLFDKGILGGADTIMATAFNGSSIKDNSSFVGEYLEYIREWQVKTGKIVKKNFGYLPNPIKHLWHGSRHNRNYFLRKSIVASPDFPFVPQKHLSYDENGLLRFVPRVRDHFNGLIMTYFSNRTEDGKEIINGH
jgi:hypothetical protein